MWSPLDHRRVWGAPLTDHARCEGGPPVILSPASVFARSITERKKSRRGAFADDHECWLVFASMTWVETWVGSSGGTRFKVDVPRTHVIGRLEGGIDARVTSARGVRLKAFVERPPRWRIATDTLAGPPPGRQCLSDTENFVFSSETGATIRPFRRT